MGKLAVGTFQCWKHDPDTVLDEQSFFIWTGTTLTMLMFISSINNSIFKIHHQVFGITMALSLYSCLVDGSRCLILWLGAWILLWAATRLHSWTTTQVFLWPPRSHKASGKCWLLPSAKTTDNSTASSQRKTGGWVRHHCCVWVRALPRTV